MNRTFIFIYRLVFAALSWFTIVTGWVLSGFPDLFIGLKYFTIQTNLMVAIWLTLAIIWHNKPESLQKITGKIKGAFTLYITGTFLGFAILLSFLYHPTGFAFFSNLVLHYIAPIAFIIDWALTENEVTYEWKFSLYWVIYPVCYFVFAIILGTFTSDYIYPFLDINVFGPSVVIMLICGFIAVFVALGCVYIAINRKRMKKD